MIYITAVLIMHLGVGATLALDGDNPNNEVSAVSCLCRSSCCLPLACRNGQAAPWFMFGLRPYMMLTPCPPCLPVLKNPSVNLSRVPRQLRGNMMQGEAHHEGAVTKANFLPFNNIEPFPDKSNTNNAWTAPLLENEGRSGDWAHEKAGSDIDKHRNLGDASCCLFAEGQYFDPAIGKCYNLGGNWWDDRITHVRSSPNSCIQMWEHETGGIYQEYCGNESWLALDGNLFQQVSRVCCVPPVE